MLCMPVFVLFCKCVFPFHEKFYIRCSVTLPFFDQTEVHCPKIVCFVIFFFFTTDSTTVFHSVKETFHALSAGIGDAYACPSAPAINLTAKKSSAEVTLTRFKFQPFGVKSGHFGNGRNYFFLCFVLTGNYVISIS